jgi:excisionase family DNA binding protein
MTTANNRRPALLSAESIATELGLSVRTVRRLIETGELRAHRFGRAVRISQEDLNVYIAKSRK